jgi:uroporphyrinogen-III synthase
MIAVLVTRPGGELDPVVQALRRRGYRVHAVPTVQTEAVELDSRSLASFDWVVFTSARGVDAVDELPFGSRFAAVGPETAKAAHVPATADGAELGKTLPDVEGKRVALVRASAADTDLPDILRRRGANVEEVTAYRTVEAPPESAQPLRTALADPDLRAVVFASGSAVRGFIGLGGTKQLPAITIGARATTRARDLGFRVIAEADTQSVAGLVDAVARVLPLEVKNNA